ncbi:hypothetical protein HK103_004113 [Boothiomyces macroporosus]|uniref:DNA polymerase epsilon subunit D n=1 Tax=Boothiomyces macroporosus TaxID=261099 RepID=A0AAD5UH61_9FUNG|nr:hypothetical protein HK103_004113 [Boothiomyces macroporosus]
MADPIENYELPKSTIQKICKGVLPEGTNLQKEAREAITKASTVFINYLTAVANEQAIKQDRKTINSSDIFKALEILELDGSILDPVREATTQYIQIQKEKRNEYRKRKSLQNSMSNESNEQVDEHIDDEELGDNDVDMEHVETDQEELK